MSILWTAVFAELKHKQLLMTSCNFLYHCRNLVADTSKRSTEDADPPGTADLIAERDPEDPSTSVPLMLLVK